MAWPRPAPRHSLTKPRPRPWPGPLAYGVLDLFFVILPGSLKDPSIPKRGAPPRRSGEAIRSSQPPRSPRPKRRQNKQVHPKIVTEIKTVSRAKHNPKSIAKYIRKPNKCHEKNLNVSLSLQCDVGPHFVVFASANPSIWLTFANRSWSAAVVAKLETFPAKNNDNKNKRTYIYIYIE